MSWILLSALVAALGLALLAALARKSELARMQLGVQERERALRSSAQDLLRHPVVDLSRCLGCGACVAACPESGVLEMLHGQASVQNGARCVGHRACERECPVGAITVTLANLETRRDVPVLDDSLEAPGARGLFLAGEVTAHALIKTAIEHGVAVAAEVARRSGAGRADDALDLCIVGAGPAGLACALEAKRLGLRFVLLDQELEPGGTVAKYPRRKLVMTQPVALPLHGTLDRSTYTKEELVELWRSIARAQALPFHGGETLEAVERDGEGFVVRTGQRAVRARHVCLALGRRGTPRKLAVPGEERANVAYSLLDARSYQGRRILVVGGGDSAVEAALGLAEQPGNQVTLSYRRGEFTRIRARNAQRIERAQQQMRLSVLFSTEVSAIGDDAVALERDAAGRRERIDVRVDDVFVMAGGTTPIALLERAGVAFDPALRAPATPLGERGTGLARALAIGLALAVAALGFALWNVDYYGLPTHERPLEAKHEVLRPGRGLGLAFAIGAATLIAVNLLYLARRSMVRGLRFGSLRSWMTAHIATGICALLAATLHGAMAPRDTLGGHALWALVALFASGAIGRYFYAWVPRAANGRELGLDELRLRLDQCAESWDESHRGFVERVRAEVDALIAARQWKSSFLGRIAALIGGHRDLRRALERLAVEGERAGVPRERIAETLTLAREAHRTALAAAHFEDLRALVNSWRYLHRWVALLLVVLVLLHVLYVLSYGAALPVGIAR